MFSSSEVKTIAVFRLFASEMVKFSGSKRFYASRHNMVNFIIFDKELQGCRTSEDCPNIPLKFETIGNVFGLSLQDSNAIVFLEKYLQKASKN